MKDLKVMTGSTPAPKKMHITVTEQGPYLVYGAPPLFQQIIVPDSAGGSISYLQGDRFSTSEEPTHLCRCGHSKSAPYCDSSHHTAAWDPALTADRRSLLGEAEILEGENLTLVDDRKYCVYARFCHPQGGTWHLTEESGNPVARAEAVRQASLCPSSRLTAWGVDKEMPYEFDYEPSLGLLEDPAIGASSGLLVRGGIVISSEDGQQYEVRKRVVVCRCGGSHNKPFCDGSHARNGWNDGLECEVGEDQTVELAEV